MTRFALPAAAFAALLAFGLPMQGPEGSGQTALITALSAPAAQADRADRVGCFSPVSGFPRDPRYDADPSERGVENKLIRFFIESGVDVLTMKRSKF